jgi:glycosyltransferase involved in cell wall biosynthesis
MVQVYVTASEFAKNKFVQAGFPPEKICIKPNFIYPDPGYRRNDEGFSLFVGRLAEEKGILALLEAWDRMSGHKLIIAGDGPLRAVVATKISAQVQMKGTLPRSEVIDLMHRAHVLVVPSLWYEVFPVVIAEAFACGLPVVTSDLGTMPGVVTDGVTGLLVRAGDSKDIAEKIEWTYEHPERMAEMGKRARKEFEDKYSAEHSYKALLNIYQLAIARNAERAGR